MKYTLFLLNVAMKLSLTYQKISVKADEKVLEGSALVNLLKPAKHIAFGRR